MQVYLNFPGTTQEALTFYQSVFGGEFLELIRFGDTPEAGRVAAHEQDKIMHMALRTDHGMLLMATDALESMGHRLTQGNNFHLSLTTETREEADQLFQGLAPGGTVSLPMQEMNWGDYFGMLTDKFGVQWMVSYPMPQAQPQAQPEKAAEASA